MRYAGENKAAWRKWAWDAIASAVPIGSKVLVLCGEGHDIPEAKSRGLKCIGIDRDRKAVEHFRKLGGVAMQLGVDEAMGELDYQAVILDYLCDVTFEMCFPACHEKAVIVLNCLRGRATPKGEVLQHLFLPTGFSSHGGVEPDSRSRVRWIMESRVRLAEKQTASLSLSHTQRVLLCNSEFGEFSPSWFSYVSDSSNQWFDSVVFRNLFAVTLETHKPRLSKKQKGKVAALRAVLTKRERVSN